MPRTTLGLPLELIARVPEFGPRVLEVFKELQTHAATFLGALGEISRSETGEFGSHVWSFTPANQGFLSRKIFSENGVHHLDNGAQIYVWVGDEIEMTETLADGSKNVYRFRPITDSLYMATTIEDWYSLPVPGEFIVKTVILTD